MTLTERGRHPEMGSLDAGYLQTVPYTHRRALGQFFTHPAVARFMVRWILESGKGGIHDPAFGLGAFLDAMPADADAVFTGSEVDPKVLSYWRGCASSRGADAREEDYLLSWGRKFGNIVCNPPYMRFQKFTNREAVLEKFERELGFRLSGYTNAASAFLLKSLSELARGGRLAYIMPLEFLNTGYGAMVKERLIAECHLEAIVRLDCEKDVFPDATTSVGIILYDSAKRFCGVKFFRVKSLDSLDSILEGAPTSEAPHSNLNPKAKWLPYFEDDSPIVNAAETVALEHYGRFIRGIATGANGFFALRPSRARELGLGEDETTPCITKSAQIRTPFFSDEDYNGLAERDERALLFDVSGQPSEEASAYIRFGEGEGYSQRFITRSRNPWYSVESREPYPLLVGVFSRFGYKIIRNLSRALNLTCFHGFQPNTNGAEYVDHLFLYFSSQTGREIVSLSARRYGDRLNKFEPNDLNTALVPSPQTLDAIPSERMEEALDLMKESGAPPEYVETWFEGLKRGDAAEYDDARVHRADRADGKAQWRLRNST